MIRGEALEAALRDDAVAGDSSAPNSPGAAGSRRGLTWAWAQAAGASAPLPTVAAAAAAAAAADGVPAPSSSWYEGALNHLRHHRGASKPLRIPPKKAAPLKLFRSQSLPQQQQGRAALLSVLESQLRRAQSEYTHLRRASMGVPQQPRAHHLRYPQRSSASFTGGRPSALAQAGKRGSHSPPAAAAAGLASPAAAAPAAEAAAAAPALPAVALVVRLLLELASAHASAELAQQLRQQVMEEVRTAAAAASAQQQRFSVADAVERLIPGLHAAVLHACERQAALQAAGAGGGGGGSPRESAQQAAAAIAAVSAAVRDFYLVHRPAAAAAVAAPQPYGAARPGGGGGLPPAASGCVGAGAPGAGAAHVAGSDLAALSQLQHDLGLLALGRSGGSGGDD